MSFSFGGRRAALATILLVTTLLRLRLLAVPLERDEGEYAYMGQLILRGELPYLAAQNMKLPGVYYAYAGVMALLGETDVAIRLGLLLINLASIVLVYLLGLALLDVTAGLAAAAAFAVLSCSPSVLGFTANAEHFVVLFVLAGMLVLARRGPVHRLPRVAAAGALLGLAVLMKQHAAAFVAFGGLYVLFGQRRAWRRTAVEALVFAAAALAPYGLTCLGFYLAGAFGPFWFWTVTYAREYATLVPLGMGLEQLRKVSWHVVRSPIAVWLLAGVGLAASLWDREARRSAPVLLSFAACSFVAVCPGLRFTDHYFLLVVPA